MKDFRYYLYLALLWPLSLLPLRVLYCISDALYPIVYKLLHYRIKVTRRNLELAFPEKSAAERLEIERKYYHHLCDVIVEIVHQLSISRKEALKRNQMVGTELIDQACAEGHPVVIYLGHIGNWEWGLNICLFQKACPLIGTIYRPVHDKGMDRLMNKIRTRFGCITIPQDKAVRTLLRLRREYGSFMIGFAADQRPNSVNLNHWTTLFGLESAFPPGGEDIGRKIDARFFYFEVTQPRRGHQLSVVHPIEPLDDGQPYPYTRAYYNMMEENIRRAPHLWLWSHRRWLIDKDNKKTAYSK